MGDLVKNAGQNGSKLLVFGTKSQEFFEIRLADARCKVSYDRAREVHTHLDQESSQIQIHFLCLLLRVHQLRFAEFACVSDAASEAPKRLLRRVKWAGAVVGVRGVALHLVQGEEVAAEGAAQAHGRVA
jgi:hypothetical protein